MLFVININLFLVYNKLQYTYKVIDIENNVPTKPYADMNIYTIMVKGAFSVKDKVLAIYKSEDQARLYNDVMSDSITHCMIMSNVYSLDFRSESDEYIFFNVKNECKKGYYCKSRDVFYLHDDPVVIIFGFRL